MTLQNLTNTKCEILVAKDRLRLLMERKEKLYCRYFPLNARIKDVMVDGGEHSNDKMSEYMAELYDIDIGTGKSLAQEIDDEREQIQSLQNCWDNMTETLRQMKGIEYQLYYEIVVEGKNITKAVEHISEKEGIDISTIWKNYYPRIKEDVNKIKRFNYKKRNI